MSAIIYNMRYRGPFEYDKFILNIFQIHNEVKRMEAELAGGMASLKSHSEKLNKLIEGYASENSILQELLMMENARI